MNSAFSSQPSSSDGRRQFHLTARWIEALAFVTGLLYVRVALEERFITTTGEIDWITLGLLVILTSATLALLIGWFQETWGGLISLLGGVCVAILTLATVEHNPGLAAFVYASPFIIAGVFLVIDAWWAGREART